MESAVLEEAKWQVLGTDSSPYSFCRGAQCMNVPNLLGPLCQSMSFFWPWLSMAHFIFGSSEFIKKGYPYAPALEVSEGMGVGLEASGTQCELPGKHFSLKKCQLQHISLRLENINSLNM